jgi:hypothetical protein
MGAHRHSFSAWQSKRRSHSNCLLEMRLGRERKGLANTRADPSTSRLLSVAEILQVTGKTVCSVPEACFATFALLCRNRNRLVEIGPSALRTMLLDLFFSKSFLPFWHWTPQVVLSMTICISPPVILTTGQGGDRFWGHHAQTMPFEEQLII